MSDTTENGATLLLTTFKYPYAKGEPFLEAELPYLREHFDRILVQPIIGMPERRELPEGFELCAPLYQGKDQKKFIARNIIHPGNFTEALEEGNRLKKEGHPSDIKRQLAWAGIRRKLACSEGVRKLVGAHGKKAAYAYWGHTPALASGLLGDIGIPFAVRFHRVDLYEYGAHNYVPGKSRAQSFPWRNDMAAASQLIFISDHGRDYFEQNWNIPEFRKKARVSRLGTLDAGKCSAPRTEGVFVIASCSRISQVKQVHLIGRLAAELAARQHKVVWHHFGVGDHDPSLRDIEELKNHEGLEIRLHGWVQNEDLMEFYRTNPIDLFVNLSLSEGVPVSIMEAISFDIPVLATAVDGTPEAVVDGVSGLLCSVDEAQESAFLANKIETAMMGPSPYKFEARKLWEERFDAARNFTQHAADLASMARTGTSA